MLSLREREILAMVASGWSTREAASELALSPKTVETYRERIMDKLGIRHTAGLTRYALGQRLIRLPAR